jgi:hypothetical protein
LLLLERWNYDNNYWINYNIVQKPDEFLAYKQSPITMVRKMDPLTRLLMHLPGSPNVQVFLATSIFLGLSGATFFGGKRLKNGHNMFDHEKPQSVQLAMDKELDDKYAKRKMEEQKKQQV